MSRSTNVHSSNFDLITRVPNCEERYFDNSRDNGNDTNGQIKNWFVPLKESIGDQKNNDAQNEAQQSMATELKYLDGNVPGTRQIVGDPKIKLFLHRRVNVN